MAEPSKKAERRFDKLAITLAAAVKQRTIQRAVVDNRPILLQQLFRAQPALHHAALVCAYLQPTEGADAEFDRNANDLVARRIFALIPMIFCKPLFGATKPIQNGEITLIFNVVEI